MASTPVAIGANTLVGYLVTPPFVTTDQYTFSFPYLDKSHFTIEVASETVLETADYEFVSDYLIQLTAAGVAKLNGLYGDLAQVDLIIRRTTHLTNRLVDFKDGATLTEKELDLSANQAFYLIQEIKDSYEAGSLAYNPIDGSIDAEGNEIVDVGYPTRLTAAATLTAVLDNVVTPTYAENGVYRTGRLVFHNGDIYRANKDIADAPAIFNAADFDLIISDEEIAQITTNQTNIAANTAAIGVNAGDISTNAANIATNAADIVTNASNISTNTTNIGTVTSDLATHEAENETAHTQRDLKATLDTWATTATNGAVAFATDENKYYYVNAGALVPFGGAGGLAYQGTWNANTNTPTLPTGTEENGHYYLVSTAGTTNLDGINDWGINDWAIWNGTAFQKIDNSELVTSVNGKTGDVKLELDEYDVIDIETFDINSPAAMFTGSASITVTNETGAEKIQGERSAKFTQSSALTNDVKYFDTAYEVTVTKEHLASLTQDLRFVSDFNGTTGDIVFRREFFNGTDWTTLEPVEIDIRNGKDFHRKVYNMDVSCTKYRDGIRIVTPNDANVLYMDKLGLSLNPLATAEFVQSETITHTGYASKNVNFVLFKTALVNEGSDIVTLDTSNSDTRYVFSKACKYVAHANVSSDSSASSTMVRHYNSSDVLISETKQYNTFDRSVPITGKASVGDYLIVWDNATTVDDATDTNFSVTATCSSSNVVFENANTSEFEWQDGGAITIDATTTAPTKPTTTNQDKVVWRRDGTDLIAQYTYYAASLTGAAVGSGDYLFKLPSGLIADTTNLKLNTTVIGFSVVNAEGATTLGSGHLTNGGGTYSGAITAIPYDSQYFRLVTTLVDTTTNTRAGVVNSGYLSTTDLKSFTFTIRVPIQGWGATNLISVPVTNEVENVYSARIANNGATASITSQSANAISSVTRTALGLVDLTFPTGMFTVAPSITATIDETLTAGTENIVVKSVSTTGATIEVTSSTVKYDMDFSVKIQRQGADYKAPKGYFLGNIKPTAHVTGGVEYETNETWNGQKVYARSYDVSGVSLTTDTTVDTLGSGLNVKSIDFNWSSSGFTYGIWTLSNTDYVFPRFTPSTGVVTVRIVGQTVTDYRLTIKYTK